MADSTNGSDDIVHHEANTKAFIGTRDLGVGDLYICKSCVRWESAYEDKCVRWDYKQVILHAVSRDGSSFCMPCLFCMVEGESTIRTREGSHAEATSDSATGGRNIRVVEMAEEGATGDAEGSGEESEDTESGEEEEDVETSEVRFAPEEPDHLDSMYGAMSQCQLLHPDTDDEEDGHQLGEGHDGQQLGEGQDSILMSDISSMEGFFTSPEDVVHLTDEGRRVLEHLNAVTVPEPEVVADETAEDGQFDDA